MSSKEERDGSALEHFSHVQDVSRAFDSLLEAKHVLQRIENKVNIQNQRRKQAPKVRRRLQLERNSLSGLHSYSPAIDDSSHLEKQQIYERKPDETFTLHSDTNSSPKPWDVSSRTRPTLFLQEDIPSVVGFHQYHTGSTHEHTLARSGQENINNWQAMAARGSSEEHVDHDLRPDDLGVQTYTPEDEIEEIVNPYAVTFPLSGTFIEPEIGPRSSPETIAPLGILKDDLNVQKLEHLRSRSPESKLEKLKEKIQEQKRRHDLLKRSMTKSHQSPKPLRKPAMKRKVGKVTFGPAANCGRAFDCSRIKSKSLKGKSPVTTKLSVQSPSPERKLKHSGLYGASAWREGQKLVQQILGPSPVTSRKHRSPKAEDSLTVQKGSCRRCHKTRSSGQNQKQQSNINELVKQNIDRAQTIQEIRPEEDREKSRASNRSKRPHTSYIMKRRPHSSYNMERRPHTSYNMERRPHTSYNMERSPHTSDNMERRPHTSYNRERSPSGKENVEADPEPHPTSSRARSYSVEQIRDFMKKKTIERRRIERETQTRMEKAMEIRKEQLDNVLKKQKEACPPKRGGCPTVSRPNLQIQSGQADSVRKDLSQWLHVTSSDLLREDGGGSGNSKKLKTEILLNNEHSSPLRLQDLAPVHTISQDIQFKTSEGLNGGAVPSHKTTDPFSPQCRAHQERLQAIWTTAQDLGRRVEIECNRLGSPDLGQHSGTSVSVHSPSPCSPSQITFGKNPIVVENITCEPDENLKINPRKLSEDILPTSVYTDTCRIPSSTKFSTAPLTRHGRRKEYTEKTTSQTRNLHPNIHREKAQKSRSASTRRSDGSGSKVLRETSLSPPRRRLASPLKTASPPNNDKQGKQGILQHEKSSSPVLPIEMTSRMKSQLQQHEKDLSALKQKAEREAEEAQRCLEEMLGRNKQSPGLKTASPEKQKKRNGRGQERESDWFGAGLKTRMELDERDSGADVTQQSSLRTARVSAAPAETESLEHSWDHTEPVTDSTSKWSEISEFYGSPNMFARFTLEMSEQYLREEELRARHQTALLRLREEALKEKTKAELALLNHQKIYWETNKEPNKVEEILKEEHEIQRSLKQEQAEIRHLQNIYKAAHQERKLLLRQQKEILRIQQSAAHIQQKLRNSGATLQVSELVAPDPSTPQSGYSPLHDSTLASEHLNQDTQSAISDLSEDDDITKNTGTSEAYQYMLEKDRYKEEKRLLGVQEFSGAGCGKERRMPDTGTFRAQRAEDERTSPVPKVCDNSTLKRSDPESREEKADTISDGRAEDISLSGDGRRAAWSLQDNLTSPYQTSPTFREDLSDPSEARQRDMAHKKKEKEISNKTEEETFVNMQDTDGEGEPRKNISFNDEDEKKEVAEVDGSEEFQQDPYIIPATQEASSDGHSVTEPITDHSSPNISAPSKSESETLIQAPSLAEFQKVSAKLINISESTMSASDQGQGGEDTESGDSEVFDIESSEFPPRGPLDKEWSENIINQDEEEIKGDTMSDEDKPTSSPGLRKPVILVMKETQSKTEMAPLACESFPTSEDLTESDPKTSSINHLAENQDGRVVRINDIEKLTSMSPEDDGNAAGMSSPDTKDQERVTERNEKQSFTESAIFRKTEMMPFHATTSKDLFQIKSLPHRNKGDIRFITVDDLQPIQDDLSEILSPVDEKLSYESADLYSPQQDQSEELPSLPRDSGSIKSGDSDTEDFPTPPEEMLLSQSESLQSSREASLMEEIHLLYDSLLTEDTLLPPDEIINTENSLIEMENSRRSPEVVKPSRPFLTLSKAEDGVSDPFSTFEIGDRVLVKLSKPGTLMYKGMTNFKAGYWAGVALDKPEGKHDGTYEGIRYFECSKNCGVFVRPGQISHLLFDDLDGSDPKKDEDDDYSYGHGPSPSDVQPHDEDGEDTSARQLKERNDGKESLGKDTNQSRSCSLETSAIIYDLQIADISPSYLHTLPEEHIVESKYPGHTLQIKQFWRGDTNKSIVPNPPQNDKHRLLLKVTDELISSALCEAIGTYSRISAPKKESVMNSSKDRDDKCMAAEERFYNLLPSMTTLEAGGGVDMLVTDLINDCVNEYKKKRQKKGENIHRPSICYSSLFLVPRDHSRTSMSQCGHRTSVMINFTDRIFQELLKDSLQVMANINFSRAQDCPAPREEAPPPGEGTSDVRRAGILLLMKQMEKTS